MAKDLIFGDQDPKSPQQTLFKMLYRNLPGAFWALIQDFQDVGTPQDVMLNQFIHPFLQLELVPVVIMKQSMYRRSPGGEGSRSGGP